MWKWANVQMDNVEIWKCENEEGECANREMCRCANYVMVKIADGDVV